MFIEKESTSKKVGIALGLICSYLLFTGIFFLVMSVGKGRSLYLWGISSMITAAVTLTGFSLKRILK